MKIRTFIEIFIGAILLGWCIIATTTSSLQSKRANEFKSQVEFQARTIDSLITLPRKTFEVELNVSDNSKTTLNAKKQSGEIIFPNNKIYELKIDSMTIKKSINI